MSDEAIHVRVRQELETVTEEIAGRLALTREVGSGRETKGKPS